jgi:AbrB family looped-hinge helix DNA binding protein
MTREVVVTRRGQTTIPLEIRKKLDIRAGTGLTVGVEGGRMIFQKSAIDFLTWLESKMTKDEAFKLLDKMRERKLVLFDTRHFPGGVHLCAADEPHFTEVKRIRV